MSFTAYSWFTYYLGTSKAKQSVQTVVILGARRTTSEFLT